jgi:ABC-type uncharacterized transport system involved in gliding motility auxiliary subunit
MNKNNKSFRPTTIALYVAGAALLATLVTGLIQLTIQLGLFSPASPQDLILALQISASTVILMLALYTVLEPAAVQKFFSGRQARYGSNAVIVILAFSGIIILANYLAFTNPLQPLDMTEDKTNALSPEMLTALKEMPDKVSAIAFYSSQYPTDEPRKLLDNMKSNSGGKFDYQFTDPVNNPLEAKKYGVTGDGKIVLVLGDHNEIATYADEAELLRAMDRLLNPEARTVYFLTGHGERDINGADQEAISTARSTLESKNYTVKTLNLLAENAVPKDAKAVIIAGPKQPLMASEVSALVKYVNNGGGLFVMEDPLPFTDFGDKPDPLAEAVETNWGIHMRNDFVVDTNSQSPDYAVGQVFDPSHPISKSSALAPYIHYARSLEFTSQPEGISQVAITQTGSGAAWGETDFSALEGTGGSVGLDPNTDTPGPLILVASAESKGRVVIIGSSAYISDQDFGTLGNGDLFVNSVDWLAGRDASIDITPKDVTQRTYNAPGQVSGLIILLSTVCLIPSLVIVAGVWSAISRRRKG